MHKLPGSCIRIAFVPEGTSSHSDEYLKEGKSENAHQATILSSKILANTVYDIISNPDLLTGFKKEFEENRR